MASLLAEGLRRIDGVSLTQQVQTNEVFATLPREHVAALQDVSSFQVWTEATTEARFVTSFDTTEEDVSTFIARARDIIAGKGHADAQEEQWT
jgi:threonine aldolase